MRNLNFVHRFLTHLTIHAYLWLCVDFSHLRSDLFPYKAFVILLLKKVGLVPKNIKNTHRLSQLDDIAKLTKK